MNNEKPTGWLNFSLNFAIAGLASSISKTLSAPFEYVKLRLGNDDYMIRHGVPHKRYNGILAAVIRNFQEDRLAIWKGNLTNVTRYFPTQGLNFAFYEYYKSLVIGAKMDVSSSYTKDFLVGGAAGSTSLVFVYPLDYARTILSNDIINGRCGDLRKFQGLFDVFAKTVKAGSVVALYKGFLIGCAGIFIYRGLYFGLYYSSKPRLPNILQNSFIANFSLAWASTVAAGIASYPLDTVRRRFMMGSNTFASRGSLDYASKILATEGIRSFFKGATVNMMRGIAGAGVLALYDEIKYFTDKLPKEPSL